MPDVFLSIGSNIEREKHIPSALRELEERVGSLTVSGVYESEAVGFEGARFYNLVAAFSTELPVSEIAKILSEIENNHGRTRDCKKFSSRTLDIDLILYGDEVLQEGKLTLPREDITRYAFVLEPLAEIAPNRKHPVIGETYAELWAKFDKTSVNQWRVGSVSDIS
ncbi:MAG: 2-amino-4-hydroxy-6-hydroxymethyldihydropteridine diphosphokinase [Methylocaldum sp.]|jgi:2-amino-4-hydroxy-6-hydroxymethyldihydropteridine diphosphokinase|uniref:2-amino-4-hydroxy-6- hydroxymethyldihydropteridine diphosphokinase n=1 Tax=Methylocaldum sp. 14B TaxID=1912213 RepID=UPI00098B10F0|nr:2-amino-4-hydroxy-6-hydroxymethyldihydropteridine diphosphokinase [Methylocaldum sp. 14B]MDV3240225.1 2-amino-4-hydroxy-6-hydroxymethyldihydropteridine diphosphokinase [Methylocaldum sp.]MVF21993.1 2-amino-4-hydroxy-6-hydroxymethyldihydropteridine diphosphokinase [Methylocaldum sp. BRCS4]